MTTKQRLLLRYFEPAVLMVAYHMNVLLCRLLIIVSFKVYIVMSFLTIVTMNGL
jgi:hypothetical protein